MSNERSPRADCSTTMGTSGISAILSTTAWLSRHHSNRLVVKGAADARAARGGDRGEPGGRVGGAGHGGGARALARGGPGARAARRGRRRALAAGLVVVARRRAGHARGAARRGGAGRRARGGRRVAAGGVPARRARRGVHAGGRLSEDPVGPVFAALADPTRRWIVETLTREGRTSVPALTAALPITR